MLLAHQIELGKFWQKQEKIQKFSKVFKSFLSHLFHDIFFWQNFHKSVTFQTLLKIMTKKSNLKFGVFIIFRRDIKGLRKHNLICNFQG